jgi:hypothetical protein
MSRPTRTDSTFLVADGFFMRADRIELELSHFRMGPVKSGSRQVEGEHATGTSASGRRSQEVQLEEAWPCGPPPPETRSSPEDKQPGGERVRASRPVGNKRRICYADPVALRSCKVACRDLAGQEHVVEATAETLYEAVAQALAILRRDDWVDGIGDGLTELRVRLSPPTVEHRVRMKDFQRWLESQGRTPAEAALKRRLNEIVRAGGSRT